MEKEGTVTARNWPIALLRWPSPAVNPAGPTLVVGTSVLFDLHPGHHRRKGQPPGKMVGPGSRQGNGGGMKVGSMMTFLDGGGALVVGGGDSEVLHLERGEGVRENDQPELTKVGGGGDTLIQISMRVVVLRSLARTTCRGGTDGLE
jgi:hypothetical protein